MSYDNKRRVVIVDDDALFIEHITAILNHSSMFEAVAAASGEALFKLLDSQSFACILLDNELGGENGLALGQAIRQNYVDPPPIVMLTGSGSERTATKAFRLGFSDYVSKHHLNAKELLDAISSAIAQREERDATKSETERLRRTQRLDSLTGLSSAAYVIARLHELASSADSHGFTLVAAIPKNMLQLRLQIGHAASETLFRDFAHRLNSVQQNDGYLGHIGTQHLAYIFERIVPEDEMALLKSQIEHAGLFSAEYQGTRVEVAASLGVSHFPQDAATPELVIAGALAQAEKSDGMAQQASILPDSIVAGDRRSAEKPAAIPVDRRTGERRSEQRHRVLKKGKIIIPGFNSVIDCTVRNISESGAMIRVDGYFSPPGRFQLKIIGVTIPPWAEKRWQVGNDIGVKFLETNDEQ